MAFIRLLNAIKQITLQKLADVFVLVQITIKWSLLHFKNVNQLIQTFVYVLFQVDLGFLIIYLNSKNLQKPK